MREIGSTQLTMQSKLREIADLSEPQTMYSLMNQMIDQPVVARSMNNIHFKNFKLNRRLAGLGASGRSEMMDADFIRQNTNVSALTEKPQNFKQSSQLIDK